VCQLKKRQTRPTEASAYPADINILKEHRV
jgi:hypothetical protein